MLSNRRWLLVSGLAVLLACNGGDDDKLRVGQEHEPDDSGRGGSAGFNPGAGQGGFGGIATGRDALSVHFEDIEEMTIEVIMLACAGDCADVEAVAHGGNPPYAFAWEDGTTQAKRRVCLDATAELEVSVTDSPIDAEEFKYEAHTTSAQLTAQVLDCSDGGTPPTDGGPAACEPEVDDVALPEDLTPDIFGAPIYAAGGASLPAGRYRATYVDGCLKYDASWNWTVQGLPTFQFVLIGATTADVLAVLPGTEAPIGVGITGYPDYDECVAANRALPPLDFDFAGGPLGLWQNDFKTDDNIGGAATPTWRLSRLPCP